MWSRLVVFMRNRAGQHESEERARRIPKIVLESLRGEFMSELTKLAETKDIGPGEAIAVEAGGQRIAVFNVNGTICAIGDTCTHRGGPLSHMAKLKVGS